MALFFSTVSLDFQGYVRKISGNFQEISGNFRRLSYINAEKKLKKKMPLWIHSMKQTEARARKTAAKNLKQHPQKIQAIIFLNDFCLNN